MFWLLLFLGVLGFAWFMYMPREGAGNGARRVGNQGGAGAGAGSRVQYQPPQTETGYGMTNAGKQPQGLAGTTTGAEPPALAAQADTASAVAGTVPDTPGVTKDYPYSRSGVSTTDAVDPMLYAATPEFGVTNDTTENGGFGTYSASTAGAGTAGDGATGNTAANASTAGTDTTGYGAANTTTAGTDTTGYTATSAGAATASASYPGYDSASGTAAGYHSTNYGATNAGPDGTAYGATSAATQATDTAGYGATSATNAGAGAIAGAGDSAYSATAAGAGSIAGSDDTAYGATAKAPITAGIDTTDAATAGVGAGGMDFVASQGDEVPTDPD